MPKIDAQIIEKSQAIALTTNMASEQVQSASTLLALWQQLVPA